MPRLSNTGNNPVSREHLGNTQPATIQRYTGTPRVSITSGVSPYMGQFRPYTYHGTRPGK